ncbi:Ubiquitin fusion degradation protein 4, partial [Coemansia sp. RSA 2673]
MLASEHEGSTAADAFTGNATEAGDLTEPMAICEVDNGESSMLDIDDQGLSSVHHGQVEPTDATLENASPSSDDDDVLLEDHSGDDDDDDNAADSGENDASGDDAAGEGGNFSILNRILIALQELTELLSISTEESLIGLNIGELGQSLANLLKGADGDYGELTGFIASNGDIMLLACRCLSNLLEALPLTGGLLVRLGVVGVLCSKLMEIEYIDLAEQALLTLMQLSKEFPAKVCEAGGLTACLTFLDFFATGTQRTALACAANCAQGITVDQFSQAREAALVLERTMFYADQKSAEHSCRALLSLVNAFCSMPDRVDQLVSSSALGSIIESIDPDRTEAVSAPPPLLLRILGSLTHASHERAMQALEAGIFVVLERILSFWFLGPAASPSADERGPASASTPAKLGSVSRISDQAWEALRLLAALLPSLPSTSGALTQAESLVCGASPSLASDGVESDPKLQCLSTILACPRAIQQLQQPLIPTLIGV